MRIPGKKNGPICEFDRTVTPMVDVVFQLLIFFVLASGGLVAEQTLATRLSAGTVSATTPAPQAKKVNEIWLHVAYDKTAKHAVSRLNGREYGDRRSLQTDLEKLANDSGTAENLLILDIAPDVPIGDVISLYDACRAARLNSINFAASPDEVALNPAKSQRG